jgi:diaminohydroxyphosphoribosylaminopyrimidine deaminase/5-amino-6-(5-phosphoribosylamino)uracil reductase
MWREDDEKYMKRCLQLAEQAKGHTSPNPMVGAVLVHNDRVIGEGYHHYYGGPHAEVNCIASVKPEDRALIPDSTMYVSLEPCAHFGLTPPCANLLVHEKVKKVVLANTDPFARVNGKGIAILKEAGIEVTTHLLEAEGRWMNRRFFGFHTRKRPYVILKWAESEDGFIGTANRQPVAISSNESLMLSHKWRTEESAIMVGYTTALNDNPRLTPRMMEGRHPLRITFDRKLQLPKAHHLFDDSAATWILNDIEETVEGNVHYIKLSSGDKLQELMDRLYDAHLISLIVEGGGHLLNSFIESGLWDEARVITGAKKMGTGLPAPSLSGIAPEMELPSGPDTLRLYVNPYHGFRYIKGMEL